MVCTKQDLDDSFRDKRFPDNVKVEFIFEKLSDKPQRRNKMGVCVYVCLCVWICTCMCLRRNTCKINVHVCVSVCVCLYVCIYPDTVKHQSKPQVYKSDIAPCGQI